MLINYIPLFFQCCGQTVTLYNNNKKSVDPAHLLSNYSDKTDNEMYDAEYIHSFTKKKHCQKNVF